MQEIVEGHHVMLTEHLVMLIGHGWAIFAVCGAFPGLIKTSILAGIFS